MLLILTDAVDTVARLILARDPRKAGLSSDTSSRRKESRNTKVPLH